MKLLSVLLLVVTAVALLAGCGGTPSNVDQTPLENTRWLLQGYGQAADLTAPVGDREAFIQFKDDGSFSGSTGCNSYFGGYDVDGDKIISKGPIGQTEMACLGPVMDQETAYMKLLATMQTFEIDNGQLTLHCDGGVLVYGAEVSGGGQGRGYSCDQFGQNNHISDDVTLSVGDTFELSLCANPTTGFSWEDAVISDETVLKQASREYNAPASDGDTAGAAGSEHYVFKALKAGSGSVVINYSRPWEDGEKGVWTYTLNYTVQ